MDPLPDHPSPLLQPGRDRPRRRRIPWLGVLLVGAGVYLLLDNLRLLGWLRSEYVVPALMILAGLYLIARRRR